MSRFRDPSHFEKIYGLPAGRRRLSAINLEDLYEVKKVIDAGDRTIGDLNQGIYGVRCKATGDRKVHKKIPADQPSLAREIALLQVLKHPNIVQYHDAYITRSIPPEIGLFMEYYEKGSIRKLVENYAIHNQENQGQQPIIYMPESFVWHVLHSLTSALQYIHHGIKSSDRRDPPRPMDPRHWPVILHRDIKPDNILLHHAPIPEGRVGRARVYPHWPFNTNDFEYSKTTFPKIVLADFVS